MVVALDGMGQVDAHPGQDPEISGIDAPFVIRDVLQDIKQEQSHQHDAGEERNGEVAASSGQARHTVCTLEVFQGHLHPPPLPIRERERLSEENSFFCPNWLAKEGFSICTC